MKYLKFLYCLTLIHLSTSTSAQIDMVDSFDELFVEVQLEKIFNDSKTFPDAIPIGPVDSILHQYRIQKDTILLIEFITNNFKLPASDENSFVTDSAHTVEQHINYLWQVLSRSPDTITNSSLIPLPFPYVVPGGRFREIYYWDSYFTMLGLKASGRTDLMKNMIDNFSYLITTYGHIPNGNRTYYLSRSQPPFFSLMVRLLAEEQGNNTLVSYLPALEQEYNFWMDGAKMLTKDSTSIRRVVRMPDGEILNRYFDDKPYPRPEAFQEDIKTAVVSKRPKAEVFRHLRAAAESGWDFSSRWFRDSSLTSIRTSEIIPVDLNALIYHMELTLAEAYETKGDLINKTKYSKRAKARKDAINKYLYDKKAGYYFDFDLNSNQRTPHKTLAASYPLFFQLADKKQAAQVKSTLEKEFLKSGGFVTTLKDSGEQWDWPNGWPPLQWITCKGLLNYRYYELAEKAMTRWIGLNEKVFGLTGKMMEKYNVVDVSLKAGGGEYPLQDGFGWTNGVYLKMITELEEIKVPETK